MIWTLGMPPLPLAMNSPSDTSIEIQLSSAESDRIRIVALKGNVEITDSLLADVLIAFLRDLVGPDFGNRVSMILSTIDSARESN